MKIIFKSLKFCALQFKQQCKVTILKKKQKKTLFLPNLFVKKMGRLKHHKSWNKDLDKACKNASKPERFCPNALNHLCVQMSFFTLTKYTFFFADLIIVNNYFSKIADRITVLLKTWSILAAWILLCQVNNCINELSNGFLVYTVIELR